MRLGLATIEPESVTLIATPSDQAGSRRTAVVWNDEREQEHVKVMLTRLCFTYGSGTDRR